MARINDFVKDAFNVDELAYQFQLDMEDGRIDDATEEAVNAKYSLNHILGEAHHRLDMAISNFNDSGDAAYENDIDQLEAYIEKWGA